MLGVKRIGFLALVLFLAVGNVWAGGKKETVVDSEKPYAGTTLNVSMWGFNMDLLEKNVFKPFEEKHGVTVVVEAGNNADRLTKMVARKNNPLIDVALFAGNWTYKAMQEGVIKPYNPELIPNLASIMDVARDPIGGQYAVGYTIQHLGLFYRTDKVEPITSWKDLSQKDLAGYLTIPGITTTYGPSIVRMLSKAWGSGFDDFETGWQKIEELAPNLVTVYSTSSQLNALVTQEEVYAAPYASFAWGTISGTGLPVESVIPEEGLVGTFSMISVTEGTKQEELAHLFIDHMLSYDVQLNQAMDLVDSPVHKDVELPEEIAGKLTYGEELLSNLNFFSESDFAQVERAWLERWNSIFSD